MSQLPPLPPNIEQHCEKKRRFSIFWPLLPTRSFFPQCCWIFAKMERERTSERAIQFRPWFFSITFLVVALHGCDRWQDMREPFCEWDVFLFLCRSMRKQKSQSVYKGANVKLVWTLSLPLSKIGLGNRHLIKQACASILFFEKKPWFTAYSFMFNSVRVFGTIFTLRLIELWGNGTFPDFTPPCLLERKTIKRNRYWIRAQHTNL